MAFLAGGASNIGEIHLEYNQPNQDSYCINSDKNIYAVFDGHGDNGHVISSYLKQNLASTFSDSLSLHPTQPVEDSLRNAFRKMNESICSSSQSESSGSTCAMAYVTNDLLYTAAVGDCSAMLVQADPSGTNIRTTALLPLHKLTNTSEFARIAKTGAQVTGEYVISLSDPNKVINMTRAFGDQDMQSAGIIARPQISITKICPKKANAPSQNGNPVLKVVFTDGEPRNNDNSSSSENSNGDESDSNGKEHPPRVPHYRDLCDDDSEESGGDSANELIIDRKRKMDDNITNYDTNNDTNNTNDTVNNSPNNTSNNNIADNTSNNTKDNACSNSNNTSNASDDTNNNNNNNNNNNTNNDTNSTKAETLKEDVKYIDSTVIDGADKDWDTFLVLSSDGLEQVEVDEIARKAHRLIKTQIAGGTTPLEINTTCSKLLQTLEDSIYEKDGIGFNDDATVILVLLSGFLPSST